MPSSPQSENELQKIYVGGMQPPRLTVSMVQKRLQSTLSNKIEFVSFDKGKSYTNPWGEDMKKYFFVLARSKVKVESKDDTENASVMVPPIDIMAQNYHNVVWKGCTLRVEKAQLDFLGRLEVERDEAALARKKKMEEQEQEKEKKVEGASPTVAVAVDADADATAEATAEEPKKAVKKATKRHLRIRKRFGEEAYVVDTKPVQTANQKEMHLSLKKAREKRTKHLDLLIRSRRKKKSQGEDIEEIRKNEANFSLQSKVYLNRAIHIQFDDDYVETISGRVESTIIYSSGDEDDAKASPTVSDDGSDSDDSTVPSSSEDEENKIVGKEEFDWSEESDNESNSADVVSADDAIKEISEAASKEDLKAAKEPAKIDTSKNSTKENSDSDSTSEGYQWSDSDSEDSDSDNENREIKHFDYSEKHDDLDEFASSFNDNAVTSWKYGEDDFAQEDDASFVDEFLSLEDDVRSNLGAVAKLYPEFSKIAPESFNEEGDKIQETTPAGWDSSGLMQRYDPFAASATTYELQSKEPEKEASVENKKPESDASSSVVSDEEASDSSDESVVEEAPDNSIDENSNQESKEAKDSSDAKQDPKEEEINPGTDQKKQVYEQKKLENIFQQERTVQGTTSFQMSSMFDQKTISTNNEQPSSGGFSFSFQPPETKTKELDEKEDVTELDNTTNVADVLDSDENKDLKEDIQKSESDGFKLKKRKGMTFKKEELNVYLTKFYNANEGIDAVLASMENPKSTEEDQAKWDEERKVLTSDWRRKQKQAQSFKKKRLKLR